MPRNSPPRQSQGPTSSPEQARSELERFLKRAKELSEEQPLTEQRCRVWQTNVFEVLKAAFGENSGHVHNFIGQGRLYPPGTPESYLEAERRKRLAEQMELLEAVMENFRPIDTQTPITASDFFGDLDIDIRRVSEPLFKDGYCAESVSAAFKELNHQFGNPVENPII